MKSVMTYKAFKKAVAEKAGISVYRLEKIVKEIYFPDAEEVKQGGDPRNYARMIGGGTCLSCAESVIEEKIEDTVKDVLAFLTKGCDK